MAQRAPTVNDLRIKLCYICREEELYNDARTNPPQAWTHPCSCTLIAHERCLLKWIQTSQATAARAANAFKCPQCGAKYELESKHPILLRFLSVGNRLLQQLGRLFTLFGVATFVCVVGSAVYVICTAYGSWALREFIGKEMYDLLLTDDPANWPWPAYVNLPLIPISLVLARAQQYSAFPSIIPILLVWPPSSPVGLRQRTLREYWTTPENARRLALSTLPFSKQLWPPSPLAFGMIIMPLARAVYRMLYSRLAFWILGVKAVSLSPAGRRRPNGRPVRDGQVEDNINVAIDDGDDHDVDPVQNNGAERAADNAGQQRQQEQGGMRHALFWRWGRFVVRVGGNVRVVAHQLQHLPQQNPQDNQNMEAGNGQGQPANGAERPEGADAVEGPRNDNNVNVNNAAEGIVQNGRNARRDQNAIPNPAANVDEERNPAAAAVEAAEQQIEVNTTSLGRQIGGALLIPAIASCMGSLLFRLSRRSELLRKFLGIKPWAFSQLNGNNSWGKLLPPPLGPWSYGAGWEGLNAWESMTLAFKLGINAALGGTRTWAASDPVWWRNSIGLGLFVVAKDCLQLLHLWLTKRELETRRVKNRDFSGVDVTELDLIPTWGRQLSA